MWVDLLLWVVYVLLAVAAGLAVWSGVHGLRCRQKTKEPTRGVPSAAIGWGAALLLVLTLLLTFLLGSTEPLLINGQWYKDSFWLRLTDMFIWTAAVMLLVAVVGVVIGATGATRATGTTGATGATRATRATGAAKTTKATGD